jgi:ligand-binding sensor domain-containing protein/two-component sensor histidine kinase
MKFKIIILLCFPFLSFAQSATEFPYLKFKSFAKNNQLPYPSVNAMDEDNDGLMWIGTTDGLVRNDGYRLKGFFKNPATKESLSDNTILGVYNFNQKIYTSSNEGVSYYDNFSKRVFQLDTAQKTKINKAFRVCFFKKENQLIVFSNDEYYIIDELNKVRSFNYVYNKNITNENLKEKWQVLDATEDGKGSIWVACLKKLMRLNAKTFIIEEVISCDQLNVKDISSFQIIGNEILIASFGEGLVKYNPTTKVAVPIKTKLPYFKKIIPFKDVNNNDWIMGGGYLGYYIINPKTFEVQNFEFDGEINNLYVDKQNTIWLASTKGLYFAEQKKELIKTKSIQPNFNAVTNFKENESVNYFISTNNYYFQILNSGNGAAQFDKNWNHIKTFNSNYNDSTHIAMGGINDIYEVDNYYWVSTFYKGLAKCTKDFKVVKWFSKNIPAEWNENKDTRSITALGNDKFLVRGYFSLAIFDMKLEKYVKIFYNTKANPKALTEGLIPTAIVINNDCYFGTERLGMFKLNMQTGEKSLINLQYNNLQITKIIKDDSILWIGTGNGLVKYNLITKESTTYLRAQGMCNEKIFRMEFSKNTNTLWMCTYAGVAALNTKTNTIKNFYTKDGLSNESELRTVFIDDNNNTVVSSIGHNSFIDPKVMEQKAIQRKSAITELLVNNENKDWLQNSTDKFIKLTHNKNNIAIHFTIENAADNDNYFYKLNDKWYSSPTGFVQFNNLAPGTYKIYVANQPLDAAINDFITITIRPAFYNTWWFYVLCLFFVSGILFAFFKLRTNSIRKETILQKTYEQKLAESEMQTLRSQMNPHFMFNTLNSINSYIIQNKTALASEYLTTFSKLMRSILDLSKQETVPLEKEINALKMYIELEALRLENKFDYSIIIDKNIDEQSTDIPSLMLQPFVENAIWHGLHNKNDKGFIGINISELNAGQIVVTIEDDGIGRAAAAALKQAQISHKSYGIDITKNRLQLLNKNNAVTFTDLYDSEGKACGTKVTITISVQNDSNN